MPALLADIQTEADIKLLIDSFYEKVNHDELLAPIFNGVAQVDWGKHMPTMYDFWSSLLLGTGRYRGRPFPKHLPLPVNATHFQRWLELFRATVEEHFAGPKADEAKQRALSIATVFEYRIRQYNSLSIL
jgi:hemoglobin